MLGLTEKQVLVLSKLLELTETTPVTKKLLNKDNRNELIGTCEINECNLSTYLTLFKSKSILVKSNNQWIINNSLVPNIRNNELVLTFNISYNGISNSKE